MRTSEYLPAWPTIECQRCHDVQVKFPYEYCSVCLADVEQEREAERPKQERAERLDELTRKLERWGLPAVRELLTELVDIVREINEESDS